MSVSAIQTDQFTRLQSVECAVNVLNEKVDQLLQLLLLQQQGNIPTAAVSTVTPATALSAITPQQVNEFPPNHNWHEQMVFLLYGNASKHVFQPMTTWGPEEIARLNIAPQMSRIKRIAKTFNKWLDKYSHVHNSTEELRLKLKEFEIQFSTKMLAINQIIFKCKEWDKKRTHEEKINTRVTKMHK